MQINIQQKPKTFIVVNPVAGVSQSETVREKIESALQAKEIPFEVYETTGKDNFKQIIRNAVQQGSKLVIVAGGDGTLSGVVMAWWIRRSLFSFLPRGHGMAWRRH